MTVLRPGAIHGVGSRHPREWWFVKRILDGRRAVPLAWDGQSRFHASATSNIAELIRVVLAAPDGKLTVEEGFVAARFGERATAPVTSIVEELELPASIGFRLSLQDGE